MKQSERTKRTYDRIIEAALAEFGTKSYAEASLSTLCRENAIPKGLLYHHFPNKDSLYLRCAAICLEKLCEAVRRETAVLPEEEGNFSVQEELRAVLSARQRFFQENPQLAHIFFEILLQPPRHLKEELRELRRDFDAFHKERYRALLSRLTLREGIGERTAMDCFEAFQEMFNLYFQSCTAEGDLDKMAERHEKRLASLLDVMLYGLVREKPSYEK